VIPQQGSASSSSSTNTKDGRSRSGSDYSMDVERDLMVDETTAVFRYFADVAVKKNGIDACVLRIKSRLEMDVGGMGDACGMQHENLLVRRKMRKEHLQHLEVAPRCSFGEQVRMIGYNQAGGGLLCPGEHLNRTMCYAKGEVCGIFVAPRQVRNARACRQTQFQPRTEIKVEGITFDGHSGGPCVNVSGSVVGILSRGHASRSYLVPASEFMPLVKQAQFLPKPINNFFDR
jgi:hypothetical protein